MIKIEHLQELSKYIKISQICKECGLNNSTIRAKINRTADLTTTESEKIELVLNKIANIIITNKSK